MSSSTTVEVVWYKNLEQGTLHKVEKGSRLEKRIKREQREVYEEGEDEPTFEPAYERLSSADVRRAQENPEKVPGYPAAQEAAKVKAAAEAEREARRNEALDAAITGNKTPTSEKKAD